MTYRLAERQRFVAGYEEVIKFALDDNAITLVVYSRLDRISPSVVLPDSSLKLNRTDAVDRWTVPGRSVSNPRQSLRKCRTVFGVSKNRSKGCKKAVNVGAIAST